MLLNQQALSNNIQVSNVRLTEQNTTDDFTLVEFDITWENSWRYANGPANWDAAWVFVKYKVGSGGIWQHAWLNNTGHQSPPSATIENGLLTPGASFNSTTNPVLGVFLYRNASGSGTFVCQDVQLRWNYVSNGLADNTQVDIRVFAIEMVYTPQGAFSVGSGGTESGAFYTYPTTTNPYLISSESQITVGTTSGNLFYDGSGGDQAGPIPTAHPKGFNAFYAMKYEISQRAYVDFLNTLSRAQQASRIATNISSTLVTNVFVMSNTASPDTRNGVACRPVIPISPAPVDFHCDLNNNMLYSESTDGLGIACNFLSYGDVAAYLDWAALRLMTEFEFEKCGRGNQTPVPNENAWGNNFLVGFSIPNLLFTGQIFETPSDTFSNISSDGSGPIRTGALARIHSDRTQSGAGYFGCMELSGNVYEAGVTVGTAAGRSYSGLHGDGVLDSAGGMNVSGWPSSSSAEGTFHRGGGIGDNIFGYRLSARGIAADPLRRYEFGGRGVRTAQ
jgi:formylglycine-generating enzyme required for sulfatase activity